MKPEIGVTDSPLPSATFGICVLPTPNRVQEAQGFYISYNSTDTAIYGSDTTALVWGQMQRFYILKGDHRQHYAPLVARGFDACLAYYTSRLDVSHEFSDRTPSSAADLIAQIASGIQF